MLDVVFGKKTNPQAVNLLVEVLSATDWTGTLYVGYPVFGGDESSSVTDALLTCEEHGVIIFDLSSVSSGDSSPTGLVDQVRQRQRELRRKLNARLVNYEELTDPDTLALAFDLTVVTFVPEALDLQSNIAIASPETLLETLRKLPKLDAQYVRPLNAAIQKTAALKPRKRRLNVRKPDSMGSAIKFIESQIANLDRWQKNAAIESPDGPQRIRGLAGSGKTIILALKAAYLHANDPDADIVVTFNTRSLYQQFKSLIRRFYFDQVSDEPDWEKLQILHAWGSSMDAGVYSTVVASAGIAAIPFASARAKFGYADAFKGVCEEALNAIKAKPLSTPQLFDYVLIDEAQDFPATFFQLVYATTRPPKRVVWAYDELQNLGDSNMPGLDELFGMNADGTPVVEIANVDGNPKEDILLPICYRNPSWLLTTALGIGLGTKRAVGQPVQMFSAPDFWNEIGYEASGDLALGKSVRLSRSSDRSAQFFSEVLTPDESIQCRAFLSAAEQAEWIAKDIHRVLTTQELDYNDILIVIPNSIDQAAIGQVLGVQLKQLGHSSHVVGVTGSRDVVFVDNSIAMCGIYRAKGNEAPLVYVVHAEYGFSGSNLSRRRNILFTALTRAKAWVRVCGVGQLMTQFCAEFAGIKSDDFELRFKYPTPEEIKKIKSAYREKTAKERRTLTKEMKEAQRLFQRVSAGELQLDELPSSLLDLIRKISKQ
jgi:superfamily I DNA and RNA helicase